MHLFRALVTALLLAFLVAVGPGSLHGSFSYEPTSFASLSFRQSPPPLDFPATAPIVSVGDQQSSSDTDEMGLAAHHWLLESPVYRPPVRDGAESVRLPAPAQRAHQATGPPLLPTLQGL